MTPEFTALHTTGNGRKRRKRTPRMTATKTTVNGKYHSYSFWSTRYANNVVEGCVRYPKGYIRQRFPLHRDNMVTFGVLELYDWLNITVSI